MIRILYFAWLKARIGRAEETLTPVPPTVGALIATLAARSGGYADAFSRPEAIRCAVNQEFAEPDQPLAAGDEVALFPPVTGG
ncbi:MAG: molybdopterin converting factor subunit 1 [Alphaproteobacteria bacterium]|nr:MAG: molybdopterin converting factor subunit 1 [Alphaproteobacteria bacterium]